MAANYRRTGFGNAGSNSKLAVCITRLHPVKGLADLLDAWAKVRPVGWQLRIAGPDPEGYGDELRGQMQRLNLNGAVQITGSIDGRGQMGTVIAQPNCSSLHRIARISACRSRKSLAAGTPVITTQQTPWQSITDHHVVGGFRWGVTVWQRTLERRSRCHSQTYPDGSCGERSCCGHSIAGMRLPCG